MEGGSGAVAGFSVAGVSCTEGPLSPHHTQALAKYAFGMGMLQVSCWCLIACVRACARACSMCCWTSALALLLRSAAPCPPHCADLCTGVEWLGPHAQLT